VSDSKASSKVHLTFKQNLDMIKPYVKKRILEQIKSVWLIVLYLIVFQTLILGIPISEASIISVGIILVVAGLTFFMEGLVLGLMPLGEIIGVKLPQKSKLPVILTFSFILGMGATFAEPAVGILQVAGSSVKAWDAPLLFLLLNKYSNYLVYSVGIGVGIAVVFGMLRFLYGWSLKPFLYIMIPGLLAISALAALDPNLIYLTGLAWDCGGVTTGPVTVPLVLALGIGISRIVNKGGDSGSGGFGVVTLASAFPILTVMILGAFFLFSVPKPMAEADFLSSQNRAATVYLFSSPENMTGYVLQNASKNGQLTYFNGDPALMLSSIRQLAQDNQLKKAVFGEKAEAAFSNWALFKATDEQKLAIFGNAEAISKETDRYLASGAKGVDAWELTVRNSVAAVQAIVPLCVFFFLVLWLILRERIPRKDELLLGIAFAVIGMGIFSVGIELGLSKLGGQVGEKLPAAFKSIELADQKTVVRNFDPAVVQTAISDQGVREQFFYLSGDNRYTALTYNPAGFDQASRQYSYVPKKGPLFGATGGMLGILVVLIFAFIMGYGATLAEPALNALGLTVEELTVGTFKKSLLMQAVAIGVGLGIGLGVAKIIWGIPLIWLLAPPYVLLMFITKTCTEEFVNIGWDSAGVTTGPITVPLVLAMGLGIGGQVGVVEGFGILAMASVYPILSVLLVSLWVNRKQKSALQEAAAEIA